MEPGKSTKHSSESSVIEDVPGLEFPVEPEFRSLPPLVSMKVMIERIDEMRRSFPKGVPSEEERLAAKVSEEFVL
jgi:hypothetical protein